MRRNIFKEMSEIEEMINLAYSSERMSLARPEIHEIAYLRALGYPIKQIANEMGLPQQKVGKYLTAKFSGGEFGWFFRPLDRVKEMLYFTYSKNQIKNKRRANQIAELILMGYTYKEICKELGVSLSNLLRWVYPNQREIHRRQSRKKDERVRKKSVLDAWTKEEILEGKILSLEELRERGIVRAPSRLKPFVDLGVFREVDGGYAPNLDSPYFVVLDGLAED